MNTPNTEEVIDQASYSVTAHVRSQNSGVQGSTLAVACFFTLILSVGGAYIMLKQLGSHSQQQKIVSLDTQKLLNEEIKTLFASDLTETQREAETVRFVKALNQEMQDRIKQGYVIVQKDALVTGGDTSHDITAELLRTLITKVETKK